MNAAAAAAAAAAEDLSAKTGTSELKAGMSMMLLTLLILRLLILHYEVMTLIFAPRFFNPLIDISILLQLLSLVALFETQIFCGVDQEG